MNNFFRKTPLEAQDRESFIDECLNNIYTSSLCQNISEECEAAEEDVHYVLKEILLKFFRLKMHHNCKRLIQQHRMAVGLSNKKKGI